MDDYKRYAINIRKLAEQAKNNNSSLTDAQLRAAILAERAIGYITGNGNTAVSRAGTPGTTSPFSSFGNLVGFATDKQIQDVLNTVNNNYKTINNALNIRIGQKLGGISDLKDCESGKPIEITNNPLFKPPDNWDNETTPSRTNPLRWDLGKVWVAATTPITRGENADECAHAAALNLSDGAGGHMNFDSFVDPAIIGSTSPFVAHYSSSGPISSAYLSFDQIDCAVGVDSFCPASKVIPWPADGKMQLARGADGKYRYSTNEPGADIAPNFTDNKHTKLDLCFDDGSGRKASIEPSYDGGYMLYERDPITDEPIGRVTRFDSNNTAVEYFSADEIPSNRPTSL
jgi:hypothetical protein